ncbi:large ribosomal subunit protein uL22-like [Aedes albopictus]|uniref:Uncharacterized protein n=1 Tax=Aedes albopictus TaxID=7160 RepID=A0ABM1XUT7_AEDAL
MGRYDKVPDYDAKSRISNFRLHCKNARETHFYEEECFPFRRFNSGAALCAQAKHWNTSIGRLPKKSDEFLLELLWTTSQITRVPRLHGRVKLPWQEEKMMRWSMVP